MGARLIEVRAPAAPEGVVLVLHGGASREDRMRVSPTQLSVIRMIPVARRIAREGRGRLAVFRLLNTHRGWDTHTTPVDDVGWALARVRERYAGVPVALVGHSLGGRAALVAGGLDGVTSVVALNPWVYAEDAPALAGRRVLVVHGDHDRIAPIGRARTVAQRVALSTDVGFVTVPGARHAMLRQGRVFEQAAAEFVAATLLGRRPDGSPVGRVLDGDAWVTA